MAARRNPGNSPNLGHFADGSNDLNSEDGRRVDGWKITSVKPKSSMDDVSSSDEELTTSYEEIMGMTGPEGDANECGGASALGARLVAFRKWMSDEAKMIIHPSVSIVNGEATDGTKNAPVLLFGPPPSSASSQPSSGVSSAAADRCGMIDNEADRVLYDRTMGCQVRAARELKKDEVMMTIPQSAMITPDLVAASDAGRAVLACCQPSKKTDSSGTASGTGPWHRFWDVFTNTAKSEKKFSDKIAANGGTQLLVKILQERKKAATAIGNAEKAIEEAEAKLGGRSSRSKSRFIASGASHAPSYKLAPWGTISTRAPILAFLIHQRFSNEVNPLVASAADPITEMVGSSASGDGRTSTKNETESSTVNQTSNASSSVPRLRPPLDSPQTFSPYARTLPSVISLPICWKRNELALLAGCSPGSLPLLDVAAHTLQLSSDLISLVEAGILHRFPRIFPRGLITWDRWIWAASVYASRAFPVSCYLNKGEESAKGHRIRQNEQFQSPSEIWDELGVMIPLLDMLNHESEANQVTWESPLPPDSGEPDDVRNEGSMDVEVEPSSSALNTPPHASQAIMHKRVKKGSQVYNNYGIHCNQYLILQYGFAQMNNPADEVGISWGLMDSVGNVAAPSDYEMTVDDESELAKLENGNDPEISPPKDRKYCVFESVDSPLIKAWWTENRLALLEKYALVPPNVMALLKKGKKMTALAYSDGRYHPTFLAAATVATMPPKDILKCAASTEPLTSGGEPGGLTLSRRHQRILRKHLLFAFTRKLEKLLQSLNNGLKDHFNNAQLWTKASSGGLLYNGTGNNGGVAEDSAFIGWQSFFDSYAYSATMEVEKRYYAMGPDSCVLTLYDGNLRSLQASIDGVSSQAKFEEEVLQQLKDIGFIISTDECEIESEDEVPDDTGEFDANNAVGTGDSADGPSPDVVADNCSAEQHPNTNGNVPESGVAKIDSAAGTAASGSLEQQSQKQDQSSSSSVGKGSGFNRNDFRRIRRDRKKGERPPAIKLHIGNLSYNTKPAELYEYFSKLYGNDQVLECHIPTERETGKSRGFGFVTMPETAALQALHSDRQHEVDGRLLKVAESNTAGSGKTGGANVIGVVHSDRCSTCGYRPRYCTCIAPSLPGHNNGGFTMMGGPPPPPPPLDMQGPPPGVMMDQQEFGGQYGRSPPIFDARGGGRRHRDRSWDNRGRPSYSRSPSSRGGSRGPRGEGGYSHRRDRQYDRDYRGHRGRSYSRSRSRSYSRGRDRERDRDRRDRDRSRGDRSRESRSGRRSSRSGGSSSAWAGRSSRSSRYSRSRSASKSRSNSGSRSYSKGSQSRRSGDRQRNAGNEHATTARARSRSNSIPPPQSRSGGGGSGSSRKRESQSRKRSRSRSRGRSGRRKRSGKKETSKRHARSRSRSNSRSSWSKD